MIDYFKGLFWKKVVRRIYNLPHLTAWSEGGDYKSYIAGKGNLAGLFPRVDEMKLSDD